MAGDKPVGRLMYPNLAYFRKSRRCVVKTVSTRFSGEEYCKDLSGNYSVPLIGQKRLKRKKG